MNNEKIEMQYILDENKRMIEIPKNMCRKVESPVKYKLNNAFEVFVPVKGATGYWISNYGRCINNRNRKDKSTFYEHKQGNVHYTIFQEREVEKPVLSKKGRKTKKYEIVTEKSRRETSCQELVAETFLVKTKFRDKIWHKDGNQNNNWYKNLIYVSKKDYYLLKSGKIEINEVNLEQAYIEYENRANYEAYQIYNSIRSRCKNTRKHKESLERCYNEAFMCQEWVDNPKNFVKWYLSHYYSVENESMAVDKDLFGNGSKIYSPDTCCILPQGLNTLLTNCKKPYKVGQTPDNTLPLGVMYNSKTGKYRSKIIFTGTEKAIFLSEYDTKEEAFNEYKKMKQADICIVAAKYKNVIPEYIYKALLEVEVEMY